MITSQGGRDERRTVLVAGTWLVHGAAPEAATVLQRAVDAAGLDLVIRATSVESAGAVSSVALGGGWDAQLRGLGRHGVLLASPQERPLVALTGAWEGAWAGWSPEDVPPTWSVLYVDLEGGDAQTQAVFGGQEPDVVPRPRGLFRRSAEAYVWPDDLLRRVFSPAGWLATPAPRTLDVAS